MTVPGGSGDAVVIVGGGGPAAGLMVIDSAFVAVCEVLSVTCTVKFDTAAAVGVPLIAPAGDSVKPAGNDDPEANAQE